MMKRLLTATLLLGCMVALGAANADAAPKKKPVLAETQQKEFTDPTTGMEFVYVPGGCFQMGNSDYVEALPVHEVCIRGFFMGKYEVTQKQWQNIMGQ